MNEKGGSSKKKGVTVHWPNALTVFYLSRIGIISNHNSRMRKLRLRSSHSLTLKFLSTCG